MPQHPKKLRRLSAPATEQELASFADACRAVEIPPPEAIRALARAFVLHVKEHKRVVLPLRLEKKL